MTIIILRHILYSVYLYRFPGLGPILSCLCHLIFIFSLIFIAINHITSLKQTLVFWTFLEWLLLFWMTTWMKRKFNFKVLLSFYLDFSSFQPGVAYKSVAYKKSLCSKTISCYNILLWIQQHLAFALIMLKLFILS